MIKRKRTDYLVAWSECFWRNFEDFRRKVHFVFVWLKHSSDRGDSIIIFLNLFTWRCIKVYVIVFWPFLYHLSKHTHFFMRITLIKLLGLALQPIKSDKLSSLFESSQNCFFDNRAWLVVSMKFFERVDFLLPCFLRPV